MTQKSKFGTFTDIIWEKISLTRCKTVLARQPLIGISPIQKVLGYKFSRNTDAMVYLIFKAELSVVKPARDNWSWWPYQLITLNSELLCFPLPLGCTEIFRSNPPYKCNLVAFGTQATQLVERGEEKVYWYGGVKKYDQVPSKKSNTWDPEKNRCNLIVRSDFWLILSESLLTK